MDLGDHAVGDVGSAMEDRVGPLKDEVGNHEVADIMGL